MLNREVSLLNPVRQFNQQRTLFQCGSPAHTYPGLCDSGIAEQFQTKGHAVCSQVRTVQDAFTITMELISRLSKTEPYGSLRCFIHLDIFTIAYLENDQAARERELEWARKHPNDVGMIFAEGSAAAAEGRIETAIQLFDQTAEPDIASGDSEAAAIALAVSAEVNSEMGRTPVANRESERALKLGRNEMVYIWPHWPRCGTGP